MFYRASRKGSASMEATSFKIWILLTQRWPAKWLVNMFLDANTMFGTKA